MSKYDNLIEKSIFDFCDDPRVTDLFLKPDETKEDYLDWIDVTPLPIQILPFPGAPEQDELTLPEVRRWEDLLRLAEILGDEELTNAVFEQFDRAGDLILYWDKEFTELQRELSSYPFVDLSKEKDVEAAKKLLLGMSDGQLVYTLRSNPSWCRSQRQIGILDYIGDLLGCKTADRAAAPLMRKAIATGRDISVWYDDGESCDNVRRQSIISRLWD